MLIVRVRTHPNTKTGTIEYATKAAAVMGMRVPGVADGDAERLVDGDLFAWIGLHPTTGNRYGMWCRTGKKA